MSMVNLQELQQLPADVAQLSDRFLYFKSAKYLWVKVT